MAHTIITRGLGSQRIITRGYVPAEAALVVRLGASSGLVRIGTTAGIVRKGA